MAEPLRSSHVVSFYRASDASSRVAGKPSLALAACYLKNSCFAETYDPVSFARCFYGQQPPAAFAKLLRIAVGIGHIEPTQQALQDYCNNYLGIDCKGFAQSFIGGNIVGKDLSEMGKFGTRVSALDTIKGHEIIIWNNFSHIAVVDRVVDRARDGAGKLMSITVEVCESSGSQRDRGATDNGVENSFYQIDHDGKSGFRVFRPYASGKKSADTSSLAEESVTLYRFNRTAEVPQAPPIRKLGTKFPPYRLAG